MSKKNTLITPVKRYLEHEVRRYNEYRRIYNELERKNEDMQKDSKDPVMAKAAGLIGEKRRERMCEFLSLFEKNYRDLPPYMQKVIDCAYRSPIMRNKTGVAMECHMHPATAYRIINAFLIRVGTDLGML